MLLPAPIRFWTGLGCGRVPVAGWKQPATRLTVSSAFSPRLKPMHETAIYRRRSGFYSRSLTTTQWHRLPEENPSKSEEKDRIFTIPNLLCVGRIASAPVTANLMIEGQFKAATAIFCLAGFTDLLDGWIARNFKGQSSSLGSFLDPLADKILVCTLYLTLCYCNLIPPSLTGLVVSRDLFLVYAGLYIRKMSVKPPFTFAKYFDVSLPTATIQPTLISKINTGFQFLLIAVSLGAPILSYVNHPYLHYLWAVTGATTFLSAVSYAFMKNTYKFSHMEYDHQFGKKLFAFVLFILFNIGFTLSFPSQTKTTTNLDKAQDCPITGTASGAEDVYSQRSFDYYKKKAQKVKETSD